MSPEVFNVGLCMEDILPETRELETASIKGQDPYVLKDENTGLFHLYQVKDGKEVTVRKSENVEGLFSAEEEKIFELSSVTSDGVERRTQALWAPEVHYLEGKYYMYYTAVIDDMVGQDPLPTDNQKHRMYVAVSDTATGPFMEVGEVYDPEHHFWGIDMTIMRIDVNGEEKLYAIWSGWEGESQNVYYSKHINEHGDLQQNLYIAEMESPTKIKPGSTRLLAEPREESNIKLVEGPQHIVNRSGNHWIIYSGDGSWTTDYSQYALLYLGGDPLEKSNWSEYPVHLFGRRNVGHPGFIKDKDGEEYMFYHEIDEADGGWGGRVIKKMKIDYNEDGVPVKKGNIIEFDTPPVAA